LPSDFNKRVYEATGKIPSGKVTTYREIAKYLKVRGFRAVGRALAQNPYAPRIPCHRVVMSDGKIGGYSRGVKKKIELLKKEGVRVKNEKIQDFEKLFFEMGTVPIFDMNHE
jgi:O-6-methylguanine DNA methyltransferase